MKEFIKLDYFFLKFRYKKRLIEGNKVFQPYVKLKDTSTHEYALNFREYKEIILTYFKVVVEELIKGNPFIFPRSLGMLELQKNKTNVVKNGKLYRNMHTQGYVPRIAWFRFKHASFLRKSWYTFNLSRKKMWKYISNEIVNDPTIIHNFPENKSR